jgi:branched-chain amino acid transport system ATP-binding protein
MAALADNPLLGLEDVHASYGAVRALQGVSLAVGAGEIVALLGPNGAGKSTTMRSIMGVGPQVSGAIRFDGEDVGRLAPELRVRRGVALVPEGRRLFGPLTVTENLLVGGVAAADHGAARARIDELAELFPVLRERADSLAGSLSGGQQQQVAIARGLMSDPKLLLLDEPSLGLSPQLVDKVFEGIAALRERGVTILLVEQDVTEALRVADRAYVLASGRLVAQGAADELGRTADLAGAYFGAEA